MRWNFTAIHPQFLVTRLPRHSEKAKAALPLLIGEMVDQEVLTPVPIQEQGDGCVLQASTIACGSGFHRVSRGKLLTLCYGNFFSPSSWRCPLPPGIDDAHFPGANAKPEMTYVAEATKIGSEIIYSICINKVVIQTKYKIKNVNSF